MDRENFSRDMRIRLRAYFNASRHLRLAETQRQLLRHMPPSLQGEVSWTIHHSWLRTIYFLRHASPRFMIELSMALHAVVFAPNDVAPRGCECTSNQKRIIQPNSCPNTCANSLC